MLPIRQGDVELWPIYRIPAGTHAVTRKLKGWRDGIVLRAGETTGHHHRIRSSAASMRQGGDGKTYVRVNNSKNGAALLEHEEHDTLTVPPGDYELRGHREYEPPAPAEPVPVFRETFRSRNVYD